MAWHGPACHGAAWHGMGRHGMAWHGRPVQGMHTQIFCPCRARLTVLPPSPLPQGGCIDLRIKWPNDLYAGPLKLGGILCHSSYRDQLFHIVMGVRVIVGFFLFHLIIRHHGCTAAPSRTPRRRGRQAWGLESSRQMFKRHCLAMRACAAAAPTRVSRWGSTCPTASPPRVWMHSSRRRPQQAAASSSSSSRGRTHSSRGRARSRRRPSR